MYMCVCIYIYIISHNDELCEDNKQGNMIVTRVREWKLPSGLVQICLFEELKSTYDEETIMGRSELWGFGEEGDREEGQKKEGFLEQKSLTLSWCRRNCWELGMWRKYRSCQEPAFVGVCGPW